MSNNKNNNSATTTTPLEESPAARRLGFEATTTSTSSPRTTSPLVSYEFSKIAAATASTSRNPSRNSNSNGTEDAASTASSIETSWADLASPTPPGSKTNSPFTIIHTSRRSSPTTRPPQRRMECEDPVAYTLWRGGQEDLNYLIEQDQQRVGQVQAAVIPQAVSGNLYDIYQDGGVDKLARPVPVFARPRY
jgi:hypothetical protein